MVAEPSTQQHSVSLDPSLSENSEQFQWTKQWYPVAVAEFLDANRPHAIQLLGREMAIWKDGSGRWRCFDDACPHRLAPFSEGRLESDGTLLCAYHAWRFDGEGQCVSIPQSLSAEKEAVHQANPKACATAYPTQERQGLIWVWPESGIAAWEESNRRSPRLVPELEDSSGRVVKMAWNFRDLPYGWDFFMENVADPAHVPVSHHGLVGNRYRDANYYDMPCVRSTTTQEGFAYEIQPTPGTVKRALHDFQPPCLMRIETASEDGGGLLLVLYATPTRPGWCRNIGCQVLLKNDAGKTPQGFAFFGLPLPTWLSHIMASFFLHQDLVFLHYQEKNIARRKGRWLDEVYTPNPQDKMVIALRQWIDRRAGGGIPWLEDGALPLVDRDPKALFDVWHTHTSHCHTCQTALKRLNRFKALALGGAILTVLAAVWLDARWFALTASNDGASLLHLPPAIAIGFLAFSGLLGTGAYLAHKLGRLFYTYEFRHSDND